MSYIKKFIVLAFFSPLFFILILVHGGFIVVGTIFYLFTLSPFVDRIEMGLEKRIPEASEERVERGGVYVVLGTGIIENYRGEITPSKDGIQRIMHAFLLHKKYRKKIIISGGTSFTRSMSEAYVYGEVLKKLGVPEEDIILEDKSRTTSENAQNISKIIGKDGKDEVVLITNAIHMPRAVSWFERYGMDVIPAPCGYAGEKRKYGPLDYLPNFYTASRMINVLKEYSGLLENIFFKKYPGEKKSDGKGHS